MRRNPAAQALACRYGSVRYIGRSPPLYPLPRESRTGGGGSDALVVGPHYQATAADLLPAARKADALVVGTHY